MDFAIGKRELIGCLNVLRKMGATQIIILLSVEKECVYSINF